MTVLVLSAEHIATARWATDTLVKNLRRNPRSGRAEVIAWGLRRQAALAALQTPMLSESGRAVVSLFATFMRLSLTVLVVEDAHPSVSDDPAFSDMHAADLARVEALLRVVGEHPDAVAHLRSGRGRFTTLPHGDREVTSRRRRA